jgi:nitroimidazol reductase NimA-like FMN-containing flavoprotein (pyridoxamine 5'-phosphate oxidase superfamily)
MATTNERKQKRRATQPSRGAVNRVRRHADRAQYDHESVHAVLDAGFHGHLAFVDDGQAIAVPMLYVRHEEQLYLHGAPASRALKIVGSGAKLCFTVTHLDGLVLARSWFHHSVNYRSAVVFGIGRPVTEREEKLEAMRLLVDHIVPGRADDSRWSNEKELRGTSIVAMSIDAASAKVRAGGPVDDEEDYALPHWAGQVPMTTVAGPAIPDARCAEPVPGYVGELARMGASVRV